MTRHLIALYGIAAAYLLFRIQAADAATFINDMGLATEAVTDQVATLLAWTIGALLLAVAGGWAIIKRGK